jgi:hypothetical protein
MRDPLLLAAVRFLEAACEITRPRRHLRETAKENDAMNHPLPLVHAILIMLGASALTPATLVEPAHADPAFQYTLQHRILLGSANVSPPPRDGSVDFESEVLVSQAFETFDETFDLDTAGPVLPDGPQATATMLVAQLSEAGAHTISFFTVIDTAAVTPPGYACGSNATTTFTAHFTLAEAATVRISGAMDGGPMSATTAFVMGNVLLLKQAQPIFHRAVTDGESEAFDEMLFLAAGNYNLQFECHGGLSNLATTHPNLTDAASLGVDVVVAIVVEGDLNGDGEVDGADLGLLLSAWESDDDAADLNDDGVVGGADLGVLLAAWTA